MKVPYIPKEISWLSFNERVLQEAENPEVPLYERLKFLGIYSNNLDEYFRVRVATLKRLSLFGKKSKTLLGYNPRTTLRKIHEKVLLQNERIEKVYSDLTKELREHKIHIINEKQLNQKQAAFVREYFLKEVRPRLMPLMLNRESRLPDLTDDAIYFAVLLKNFTKERKRFSLLEIPSQLLPRFVVLPEGRKGKSIIFLDDIIRYGLKDLFTAFRFDEARAFSVKITKDAELEIGDDISGSYIEKLSKSLQQRKKGPTIRFVYDRDMPHELYKFMVRKLKLDTDDVRIAGDRYHNLRDFMNFTDPGEGDFRYKAPEPVHHCDLPQGTSILSVLRKRDIMLFFPYHLFDHFIDLLREASIDPYVTSIEITLYRLARNSSVINALLNAARNGKSVTTVVELQARFDEEANILWGNRLLNEGVRVIYGVPGLKVHSKLCLITRVKNGITREFAAVGTGNFNEDTARVYTDHLLLTTNKRITNEVTRVFSFFSANYRKDKFSSLVLSPFHLRNKIIALTDNEIKNARAGKEAAISIKMNNITDEEVIRKLCKAGSAGVTIRILVRGMFSMVPGIPGVSENIEAKSIVDMYLEHSRFMIFHNNGDPLVYISSADIMPRNLDRRIEVTCPVFDRDIRKEMTDIFEMQWRDNVKSRIFDESQSNIMFRDRRKPFRAQTEISVYFQKLSSSPGSVRRR